MIEKLSDGAGTQIIAMVAPITIGGRGPGLRWAADDVLSVNGTREHRAIRPANRPPIQDGCVFSGLTTTVGF